MSTEEIGVLPDSLWSRRLAKEYALIRNYEPTFSPVNGDLTHYKGTIIGTGYYEGGVFVTDLILERTFPFTPPKVLWHTRIWHPNFTDGDDGPPRVCESILNKDWYANMHVVAIIEALKNLLANPNPDDPLNVHAAFEMKNYPARFLARVNYYLRTFATMENARRYL